MKRECGLSRGGEATIMNNLYNKPCVDVISVFLLHLEMMADFFYKNKREMKSA